MNDLLAMRAFVQIVESGSISNAARRLNMSVSSVSRHLNALEDDLGVRLLNRTTRNQNVTEAGRIYLASAVRILSEISSARRGVAAFQSEAKGVLRVEARASVGGAVIGPALPRFLESYPDMRIDFTLNDERADLVAEGIDVAVWLGKLSDSSMIARRLSRSRRLIVGSPSYFERFGHPRRPEDLQTHNCLVFKGGGYADAWRFEGRDEIKEIPLSGNLRTTSSVVLLNSAMGGLGLALLHAWMVRSAIEKGRLVPVLADYDVSPTDQDTGLYAVYPHSRGLSPKVRVFIDFLVDLFEQQDDIRAALPADAAAPRT